MRAIAPLAAVIGSMTVSVAACAGTGTAAPVPAVLVSPDRLAVDEVERAAASLTGASTVSLSADILTESSELVLGRQTPRTMEGDPAGGMIMDRPSRLTLMTDGDGCYLVHGESGESEKLDGVTCAPVKVP